MNYCTPTEYYLSQVIKYPTMYLKSTFDAIRFSILDQSINVSGNGCFHGANGLLCEDVMTDEKDDEGRNIWKEVIVFRVEENDTEYTLEDLIQGNIVRVEVPYRWYTLEFDEAPYIVTRDVPKEIEKEAHWIHKDDLEEWLNKTIEIDGYHFKKYEQVNQGKMKSSPYPSFSKSNSMLWEGNRYHNTGELDMSQFSKEWIQEFIWFYEECKRFFNSPEQHNASYYPTPYNKLEIFKGLVERHNNAMKEGKTDKEFLDKHNSEYGYQLPSDKLVWTVERVNDDEAQFHICGDDRDNDSKEDYKELYCVYTDKDGVKCKAHATALYHRIMLENWESKKAKYFEFIDETLEMLKTYL